MIHPDHLGALRRKRVMLGALLAALIGVWAAPAPQWAGGIAGYLPLHTAMEVLAVVIAALIFGSSWSSQRRNVSVGALVAGCAFLGVALLDLSHTLSYAGMPDYVTPGGAEKAIDFWLAARTLAAIALLILVAMPALPARGPWLRWLALGVVLAVVGAVHVVLLLYPEVLPRTFVPGQGLTPLKIGYEYALIAAYVAAAIGQFRHLRDPRRRTAPALMAAALTMAMSEFLFTLYADVTDLYNLMGHLYKVLAYLLLYRAIFIETVEQPYRAVDETQARLRATLAAVPDLLWLKDANGFYLDCNPSFERLYGAPRDAIVGKSDHDFVSPELADSFRANDRLAMEQGRPRANEEWLTFASDGYRGLFETVKTPVFDARGQVLGVLGIARDITLARAALEAERASEQRLQQAVGVAQIGIYEHDHRRDTLQWSDRLRAIYGFGPEVPAARETFRAHVHPDDLARLDAAVVQRFDPDGDGLFDQEVRFRRPDGGLRHLALRAQTVFEDGVPLRTVGAVVDITERKQAEADMRMRERALTQISQGVMITDAQRRLSYVNPGFERLTGYAAAEVLGQDPGFLHGPGTSPTMVVRMRDALREGRRFRGEILYYRKDGGTVWVDVDITPMHDEQGRLEGFVGTQRDITEHRRADLERRHLELQLRESQKMESIGTLAGGIAHDFNNILGSIRGSVVLAAGDLPPDHPAQASLAQIGRASARARDLVNQILAFSRRSPQVLVRQALQPLVQDALAMLRSTLPAQVVLEQRLEPEPVVVQADASQVTQVVLNLCTNAWHALADRHGTVTVGVEVQAIDAAQARKLGLAQAGRHAHLWVRDTGRGMDAATRARIFEPFFTTKPPGEGTGLGLAVVHGIVVAHQGVIAVDSAPGAGSTFHVYLPVAGGPAEAVVHEGEEALPSGAGHGRHVVYVDDDEVMRLVVERLLERAGFHVSVCASAEEALALLDDETRVADVLVTDHNMPGTSGLELARAVRARRSALPVVLSSGFISESLRAGAAEIGVRYLLKKQDTHETIVPTLLRALADAEAPT